MEHNLRARRLASAASRQQQKQTQELAMQQANTERTKMLPDRYSSEEDVSSEDDGNSYSPIPDPRFDQDRHLEHLRMERTRPSFPKPTVQGIAVGSARSTSQTPLAPLIPELIVPKPMPATSKSYHIASTSSHTEVCTQISVMRPEAPIRVATPISYSIPRARPSMISISAPACKNNLEVGRRPASLQHTPPIPARSDRRVSTMSVRSVPSSAERPPISFPAGQLVDRVGAGDGRSVRRRPVPTSIKSASTLQSKFSTYDVLPPRSKMASSSQPDRPKTPAGPGTVVPSRHTPGPSSGPQDQLRPPVVECSTDTTSKQSASSVRKRRSSIGLTLRNASSILRGKNISGRPSMPNSATTVESNVGVDVRDFPMPPPSPLPRQQNFPSESKSPDISSENSRLRRVRTTIGL